MLKPPSPRRIYLAHPLPSYGTAVERAVLRALSVAFPSAELVNILYPTGADFRRRYRREVRRCDAFAFFGWRGAIGLGVFLEMGAAAERAPPILLFHGGRLYREWRLTLLDDGRNWRRYAAVQPVGSPLSTAQPAVVRRPPRVGARTGGRGTPSVRPPPPSLADYFL